MFGGKVGLKKAVLSPHCGEGVGFTTTAAWATPGSAKSGANAHAAVRACKPLSFMTGVSSFPLVNAGERFV
jgi:hypothetical protein